MGQGGRAHCALQDALKIMGIGRVEEKISMVEVFQGGTLGKESGAYTSLLVINLEVGRCASAPGQNVNAGSRS